MEDHTKYIDDFILDDSFKEFVSGGNQESTEKWMQWIKENPLAVKDFDSAVRITRLLLKSNKQIPGLNMEEELDDLLSKIRNEKNTAGGIFLPFQWLRLTGIILILVSAFAFIYFALNKNAIEETAFNELIVPLGEKSQLMLSDGTHIWINSSSKLTYPVSFDKQERTIYLEGEAFFEVKKNEKPFVVNTRDLKVKVLGTSFNIKNYPGDRNAVTTVVKGLVSVQGKKQQLGEVLLKPNQNYVLNVSPVASEVSTIKEKKQKDISVPGHMEPIINRKVNVEAITSWKDQMLVFMDEPLEDVALKMERWYNVKIHILDEGLKKERYRGKFTNNETIFQVFEAIKITTPIQYKWKNNEFYINKPR